MVPNRLWRCLILSEENLALSLTFSTTAISEQQQDFQKAHVKAQHKVKSCTVKAGTEAGFSCI